MVVGCNTCIALVKGEWLGALREEPRRGTGEESRGGQRGVGWGVELREKEEIRVEGRRYLDTQSAGRDASWLS